MTIPTIALTLLLQAPDSVPSLSPLPAATAVEWTESGRIADQLLSPYCPGRTLSNCPSPSADSLRREIHGQLVAGQTREQVLAGLVKDFGEGILGAPRARGFARVLWITPWVAMVIGFLVINWLVRRRRAASPVAMPATPRLSPADQDRLDEAMRDVQ